MQYCYRVAGAVGLISIEIFGYQHPGCRDYAEKLGYALQWTNILRDVGEDAAAGRIYLPLEDLRRFGLSEEEILGRIPDDRFLGMMEFQCARAENWFREAAAALPECDRRSMKSAELMRLIYWGILRKMKRDRFRVFEKRYRLSKGAMLLRLIRALAAMKPGAGRASTGTWERCWEPALRSWLPCSATSPTFPSHAKSSARDLSA